MVHFRNGDTVSKGRHSENVFGMADLRNSGFRNGGPSEWRESTVGGDHGMARDSNFRLVPIK